MKKLLLLIFFSLFWSNNSFADQWFDLIQINCYEKSGYFELRKIGTWNLNMWEVAEDENLVNLQHSKNVTKKCVIPKRKFVDEQFAIEVAIRPYCRNMNYKCLESDAEFDIWHIDKIGKKKFIDKGKFAFNEKRPSKNISRIEFLPKDNYFTIFFEKIDNIGQGPTEVDNVTIFMPDTYHANPDQKLPLTFDDLLKMF
jgi:hypothetical protein